MPDQARESALAAARAEAAAASNALKTVETGINYYAARKEYIKLKDIAEASDVAGKVRAAPLFPPFACVSVFLCIHQLRPGAADAAHLRPCGSDVRWTYQNNSCALP